MNKCDYGDLSRDVSDWRATKSIEDVLDKHLAAARRARALQAAARARQTPGFHSARRPLYARRRRTHVDGGRVPVRGLTREGVKMRKWLAAPLLMLGALLLVTAVTACGGSGSNGKSGGTFRLGTSSGIDSLNPFVAFNQDAYSAFEYIYPILVQYDSKLHFAPFFATSWQSLERRQDVDVQDATEREVERRQAADRGRRGLDDQHRHQVQERRRRELGGPRQPHQERDRPRTRRRSSSTTTEAGADVRARPVPAVLHPPEAHLVAAPRATTAPT